LRLLLSIQLRAWSAGLTNPHKLPFEGLAGQLGRPPTISAGRPEGAGLQLLKSTWEDCTGLS